MCCILFIQRYSLNCPFLNSYICRNSTNPSFHPIIITIWVRSEYNFLIIHTFIFTEESSCSYFGLRWSVTPWPRSTCADLRFIDEVPHFRWTKQYAVRWSFYRAQPEEPSCGLAFLRRVIFPSVQTLILTRFGVARAIGICQTIPLLSLSQVVSPAPTTNVPSFRCALLPAAMIVVEVFAHPLSLAGLPDKHADILQPYGVLLLHRSDVP